MIGTLIKQGLGLCFLCVLSILETKPLLLKMQQMFIIAINVKIEKEDRYEEFFPLSSFRLLNQSTLAIICNFCSLSAKVNSPMFPLLM